MMFLTVILYILTTTTAIRVPTAWPELKKQVPEIKVQQQTYNLGIHNLKTITNHQTKSDVNKLSNKDLHVPKLEQQIADATYVPHFVQPNRRPSGSHEVFVTNNKKSQYSNEKYSTPEPGVHDSVPQFIQQIFPSLLFDVNVPANNNEKHKGYYNPNVAQAGTVLKHQYNDHKINSFLQPVVYVNHNVNFPTSTDGWVPIAGQYNPRKVLQSNPVYAHHNLEDKHNQISNRLANRRHSIPVNPRRQHKNSNDRQDIQFASHYQAPVKHHHVSNKNYSDDKIQEPSNDHEIIEIQDEGDSSENVYGGVKEDVRAFPTAEHETPRDVSTKPIYPGEGQWAVQGLKHQPFVSNHRFTHLADNNDEKPEGFETFQNAAPAFERQFNKFSENLQSFPQKHALGENIDDKDEHKTSDTEQQKDADEEVEEDEEEYSFIPTRTLAQVRKTENEEHLPSDLTDARLREVIKDSKIHTVYTEEGYEDVAYDHAGHEKNAEEGEGHEKFDKDAVEVKHKNPQRRKPKFEGVNIEKEFENYEDATKEHGRENTDTKEASDTDVSASDYDNSNSNPNNKNMKEFLTTKRNSTTEIKKMDDDVEMEITSEIKIMTQPNNVKAAHKFVRIVPKRKTKFKSNEKKLPVPYSQFPKIQTRRKRFVNDFPKIQVEKDFLDVLHSEKPKTVQIITTEKYPYYDIKNTNILNRNSPLRYAEDMKNIPKKLPGKMTFYEQSKISECPEIPRNVNPIPDRVEQAQNKNQDDESSANKGVAELPDVPRLRNLGDKIDCLKLKLFGENPLDSPIFHESSVGPPESIFEELHSLTNLAKTQHETSPSSEGALNEAADIAQSLISQAASDHNEDEHQGHSQETYHTSDSYGDYEDNDKDYQNVHKTIDQDSEETLSSTPSNNSLHESPVETSSEESVQLTEKRAVDMGRPIVSTTTFATNTLPVHYDDKLNLIPKHIYDQIDFPENSKTTSSATPAKDPTSAAPYTSAAPFQDQVIKTTENLISSTTPSRTTTTFIPKHIYDKIDHSDMSNTRMNKYNVNTTTNYMEIHNLNKTGIALNTTGNIPISIRQPKAFDIVKAPNLSKENLTRRMDNNESLPESAALRIRRRRRKRPQAPLMHIFDVNRFLPTPLPFIPTYPTTNTVLPIYKTLSEVYYKDEIKPNEQLNVFADVINNIKNSPPEVLHAEGSENFEAVEEDSWKLSGSHKDIVTKLKVPPRKVRIKHNNAINTYANSDDVIYITTTTTSTTTAAPRRRRKNKYKNHKFNPQVYEEFFDAVKKNEKDYSLGFARGEINKTLKKENPFTMNGLKDSYTSEDTSLYHPVINGDLASETVVEDVHGLNPPFSVEFPAVYPSINNQHSYPLTESTTLNTFLVPGMKPPRNRKPLLYSDFRSVKHNRIRRRNNYHRIRKRSPYKPNYSEIRRNKPVHPTSYDEEENEKEKEEEDDYVPKRNRNFHYDVENDRVVYINKKEEEEEPSPEPQIEEVEEEEEGVEYLTLRPVTPKPKFVVITTERNGPSFLEYVQQLKNNSNYRIILDPQPTKKPTEEVTAKSDLKEVESTTTKQVESVVPEFLSIISKLKSNNDYKEIKDRKTKLTTTAAPEEEVIEENDDPIVNIKNSPGGSENSNGYDRSQIFDISEYLPQQRDYGPKTVIDYSKYKTIERTPVSTRHSLSSRYNSEDDDLPLSNKVTTQIPILVKSEDNDKSSSSEQEIGKVSNSDSNIRRTGYSSSEEGIDEEGTTRISTTKLPEVTTTRPRIIRTRGRKRPTTTLKPTTSTTSASTSRKRTRYRSRPTTTIEPTLEENYSQTQRVVHRRLPIRKSTTDNQNIPHNHKAFYTPINIEEEDVGARPSVVQRKRKVGRLATSNRIQLSTNSTDNNSEELGKPGEIQPRKLPDVHVFKKYDPNQKHGGNYRREFEDPTAQSLEINPIPPTAYEIENSKEIKRLADVVPKPFAFYSDPTLPKSVNQLKEPKTVDLPSDLDESEPLHNGQDKAIKLSNADYDDEVKINFNKHSETATKIPIYIVKDPSKRLYYYAPVK